MKRNSILLLIFFLLPGSPSSALLAKKTTIIKVKVQMANVRSEPDATAPVVARVPGGTLLEVTSRAGAWYEVSVNDRSGREISGFIRNTVVDVIGDDEEDALPRRGSSAGGRGNGMRFGINFGVQTDDGFSFDPFLWTVGAELDFPFGKYLMLSPEVMLVGSGFAFKEFILYPAVLLNFTARSFYAGGGVAKGFLIGSVSGSGDFVLKLNAGLVARNIKLTVYALMAFDSLFQNMALGASLGFRF